MEQTPTIEELYRQVAELTRCIYAVGRLPRSDGFQFLEEAIGGVFNVPISSFHATPMLGRPPAPQRGPVSVTPEFARTLLYVLARRYFLYQPADIAAYYDESPDTVRQRIARHKHYLDGELDELSRAEKDQLARSILGVYKVMQRHDEQVGLVQQKYRELLTYLQSACASSELLDLLIID